MALATASRFRGDTVVFTRTLGIDLTGATVLMTLSDQLDGGTKQTPLSGTVTNAATGAVTFPVGTLNLAVGLWYWDVQVTNTAGILTAERGVLTIDQDVTV